MAFGRRSAAHRGIPTTTSQQEDDFQQFCHRQQARAAGAAYRAHRRYVDRLVKLYAEHVDMTVTMRGHTQGGGPSEYASRLPKAGA